MRAAGGGGAGGVGHSGVGARPPRPTLALPLSLPQLGWKERTSWHDGLRATVDWYLGRGLKDYWDGGDVEAALAPHPIIRPHTWPSGPGGLDG